MADNKVSSAAHIFIEDQQQYSSQHLQRHQRRSTKRCCLKTICVLFVGFVLVIIATWNYKLQLQIRKIQSDVYQLQQISIAQPVAKKPNTAYLKSKRVVRTSGKVFPAIHLGADDGTINRPNSPPCTTNGQNDRVMKLWKLDQQNVNGGMVYDSSTGKVTVPQDGYYHVYAQVRLRQDAKLPTFAIISIMVGGKEIVSATLNDTIHTQRIATLVKLKPQDTVYIQMGLSNKPFHCFSKKIFTYFGLYLVS